MSNFRLDPYNYLSYLSLTKYSMLTDIVNTYYVGSDSDYIDLYVDLTSFINILTTNNAELDKKDELYIAAWVINLCAHYKRFFKTRYGVTATIFLIYRDLNDNGAEYRRVICPEYTRSITDARYSNTVVLNINMLKDIVQYIPNVELVRTRYEFGLKALFIKATRDNIPSMIISEDIINTQLAVKNDKADVCILYPKKNKQCDTSYLITQDNAIYNFINKYKRCQVTPLFTQNAHYYIPVMMAMTGYSKRGFKSIYNITECVNGINTLISNGMIRDGDPTTIDRFLALISSIYPKKVPYNKHIIDRFMCLNFSFQYSFFNDSTDIDPYIGPVYLHNPQAIYEVNDKVFKNYELDVLNL